MCVTHQWRDKICTLSGNGYNFGLRTDSDFTQRRTKGQRTLGYCYTTTAMWTGNINFLSRTPCLTARLSSYLPGSSFMRNIKALKRPAFAYPENRVQSTIRQLNDSNCLIHVPTVCEKRKTLIKIVLPFKEQKSSNAYEKSSRTSLERSTQILARFTQVQRSRTKSKWGKTK